MIFLITVGILIAAIVLLFGVIGLAITIEEEFDIPYELSMIIFIIIGAGIVAQILYSIT